MPVAEGSLVELDANFLIEIARGIRARTHSVERWLRDGVIVQVSTVAWSEFLCGPVTAEELVNTRAVVAGVQPFTERDAELAAKLFNATGRRSRSLVDCMIAAHAIQRNAQLATANRVDFQRFEAFHLHLCRE